MLANPEIVRYVNRSKHIFNVNIAAMAAGEAALDHLDEYKLVADMYLAAKDALKPGAISGETYKAANKIYRSAKGEDYWRRVGANMGLSFGPVDMGMIGRHIIEPWTPFILQIVEVEPALVTCCSTLLVTDSGCEELTPPQLEMNLII